MSRKMKTKKMVKSLPELTELGEKKIIQKLVEFSTNSDRIDLDVYSFHYKISYHDYRQWLTIIDGRLMTNSRGKIAKRIKNNMKRELGVKLTQKQVSELGNMCHQYSGNDGIFYYEFDSVMSLPYGGHFGDGGSCFYWQYDDGGDGNNFHHRIAMNEDGRFYAVKIYTEDNEPYARSLAFIPNDKTTIIFNAYGMTRIKVATLLSTGEKMPMIERESFDSDIYINSDLCSILGDKNDTFLSVYLDVDEYHSDDWYRQFGGHLDDGECCSYCNDRITTDCDWYHLTDDGDFVCEHCVNDNFSYCEDCEQYHEDGQVDFTITTNGDYVCEYCLESNYTECEYCGDFESDYHINHEANSNLCDSCLFEHYSECDDCGRYVSDDDINCHNDSQNLCDDCFQNAIENDENIEDQIMADLLSMVDEFSAV